MHRHTRLCRTNVDVTSCTRDCEIFTIVREAQVGDGLLANGDRPSGDPLAGVEQVHYRVVPARSEVATTGIESGSDAASNVGGEVFAQRERGNVDDADGMLRHVAADAQIRRQHRHSRGSGKREQSVCTDGGTIHVRPLCLGCGVVGVLPVRHEEELASG